MNIFSENFYFADIVFLFGKLKKMIICRNSNKLSEKNLQTVDIL